MSDYTPTTEELKSIWGETFIYEAVEDAYSGFDRWLAEVKAQERMAERERIKQRLWDDGYLYEMERDHVWSLIKGEEQ